MNEVKEAGKAPCGRRDHRYPVADAWLEWIDPAGCSRRFQVLDLSHNGVSLGLTLEGAGLQGVTEMCGVLMRIDDLDVRGRIVVAQSSESLFRGTVCGGEFQPASAEDARRFQRLVADHARRSRAV